MPSGDVLASSQPSHSHVGQEKEEAYFGSTPHVESMIGFNKSMIGFNKRLPKYHVDPTNAMPQSLYDNCRPTEVLKGSPRSSLALASLNFLVYKLAQLTSVQTQD